MGVATETRGTPRSRPALGGELLASFAFVFAAAVLVAVVGAFLLSPLLVTPVRAILFLGTLVAADVVVFTVFGHYLLRRRVLRPLDRFVQEVEAISEGDYARRLDPADSLEMHRLSEGVNLMTERLLAHQHQLAANVRSLERTNQELTEARDELLRVEKIATVGRLASGIAHEIGNPLGAILGYLGVLERGADAEHREFIGAAESEARRIDRIVHGLLDYARPREASPRVINANEVIERTIELLGLQGKLTQVQLTTSLDPEPAPVRGDWNQLQQILVNLLINAIDAMEGTSEPRLTVTTTVVRYRRHKVLPARRRDDPPDVDYSHRRRFNRPSRMPREEVFVVDSEVVRITVEDSGPGIPPEHREHVFEPFYTTKEPGKGTGLGLAVAARLVDSMSGTIRVESGDGGGASFVVLLPRADESESPDSAVTQ